MGDPSPGAIRVLNEGGTAGCSVTNVATAPLVDKGGEYVIFLRDGEDSSGNKRSDLDVIITAWAIDSDGNVATEEDGILPLADVAARIGAAQK